MAAIAFYFTRMSPFLLFALLSCPIPVFGWFLNSMLDGHPGLQVLRNVLGFLGIMYFLALGWLAHTVGTRMTFGGDRLSDATRFAFADARIALAFVPIIGKWVAPRSPAEPRDLKVPIE